VFFESFLRGYDTSVAWTVSTIFCVVCFPTCVDTFADLGVCLVVSHGCTDESIKGIEISLSITVVVCVDVFDDTAIECVEVGDAIFFEQRR
jgi:hypothetical protein